MTLHYFDLHQGRASVTIDFEGCDCDSSSEIRTRATQAARDIMSEEVRHGALHLDSYIEVRTAQGDIRLRFPFRDALSISR